MNVTWDAPVGQVDSYTVTLHNDNVMENSHTVSNDSLELVFQNLKPGKVYVVRVVTNSGPLTEASLNVTNATCKLVNVSIKSNFPAVLHLFRCCCKDNYILV